MNTNKNHTFLISILIISSFIGAYVLSLSLPNFFDILNLRTYDYLFQIRYKVYGKQPLYPYIVHVDIDDSGIKKIKQSEWSRKFDANIINLLTIANVNAIAYDIVFRNPRNSEEDKTLIEATTRSGRVYYPVVLQLESNVGKSTAPIATPNKEEFMVNNLWQIKTTQWQKSLSAINAISVFPELGEESKGIGHISTFPDRDGIHRRFPLLVRYLEGYFPSLTFRMVCDYLLVSPSQIEVSFGKHIILHGAKFPHGQEEDIVIPIDEYGNIIINFAGPWANSFHHYSFVKLLEVGKDDNLMELLRDEMEGDLVVISNISTGGGELSPIPIERTYPLSGLHTNIANTILTKNFLDELPVWQQILVDFFLATILIFLAYRFRAVKFSIFSFLSFLFSIVFVLWLFFYQNSLMNIIIPSLGFLFSIITVNVYRYLVEEREKTLIRHRFENYFAPTVLNKILQSPHKLETSEKKVLTVLFSDISGFTSWCTTQEPEEIRSTLNEYFNEMVKIVFKHEGTIDKYIGDGLMIFFGDPFEQTDHAVRAVKTAIEMQLKAREIRQRWQAQDRLPIKIRIGINTGEVVVGNMGSEKQMDYTVLGRNVNLAQRLEANAPLEGILISESVFKHVKDFAEVKIAGKITTKGIEEELNTYEVKY